VKQRETAGEASKLWGGRFEQPPDELFYQFQRSFPFDRRLLPYELAVDRAWARGIEKVGILSSSETQQTLEAIDAIAKRAESEPAWLDLSPAEDVHHFVEMALVEHLGPLGFKLHTARSRNELVATDFRMFVKEAAQDLSRAVSALIAALIGLAERTMGVPLAGMTHLQHAQPILFSHFILAHVEAFFRDLERLATARRTADSCPLGSGALGGSSFPIDRAALAKELGFSRISANSLDAVGDRDFALDYLYALAGMAAHISRLAEDFVLFASQEFGYVLLPDEYSTGSSLMPQKKNPDAWELIRGKTGRITGALLGLLTTLKGLPTSYQRDLQEDKEALFAAHDQIANMLAVAAGALSTTKFNAERLRAAASNPALLATEAADYLVHKGIPFRQAHDIVGKVLREAEKQNMPWTSLPLETLKKISPAFEADFANSLSVTAALAAKKVPGGTAPESVRDAIANLERRLNKKTIKTGAQP